LGKVLILHGLTQRTRIPWTEPGKGPALLELRRTKEARKLGPRPLSETPFSSGDCQMMSNFLPGSETDTVQFMAYGIQFKDQNFRWFTQHGNKRGRSNDSACFPFPLFDRSNQFKISLQHILAPNNSLRSLRNSSLAFFCRAHMEERLTAEMDSQN
jgi:hypothetical protein